MTERFMKRALNGNGEPLIAYNKSFESVTVQKNQEFRELVETWKREYKESGKTYFIKYGFEFKTGDCYFGIQHATVEANVESNGNCLFTITDTYDFILKGKI